MLTEKDKRQVETIRTELKIKSEIIQKTKDGSKYFIDIKEVEKIINNYFNIPFISYDLQNENYKCKPFTSVYGGTDEPKGKRGRK